MTPPSAEVVYSAQMVARRRAVRAARRTRIRRTIVMVIAAGGLAYGGWALVHSSLFAVDGIRVAGLERVSLTELMQATGVNLGTNVLSVDPAAVAARIEAIPYVESATVERVYPSQLKIVVRERVPAAVLALPAGQWLIDAHGVPLEPVAEYAGLPVLQASSAAAVTLGSPVLESGIVEGLRIWRALPGSLRRAVKSVDATSAAITLRFDGWRIVVGSSLELQAKLRVLDLVLARARADGKRPRSIDLRAPERPAVRFA